MKEKIEKELVKALWGDPGKLLRVGKYEIECYVLEDGTSVLAHSQMFYAVGLGRNKDNSKKSQFPKLTRFLSSRYIKPFISNELANSLIYPILFIRPGRGGSAAKGIKASLLIDLCEAIIHSFQKDQLPQYYMPVLMQAQTIVTSFAKVGIDSVIWEITGYLQEKNREMLQAILDKYLLQEYAKWAKRFPDEFWIEIFKLKKWEWQGMKVNRPSFVGKIVNDVVYSRLAPGVLEELQKKNPIVHGKRKARHHQFLTDDIGHPALQYHLHGIMALMRASLDWTAFQRSLVRSYPKLNDQLFLDIEEI